MNNSYPEDNPIGSLSENISVLSDPNTFKLESAQKMRIIVPEPDDTPEILMRIAGRDFFVVMFKREGRWLDTKFDLTSDDLKEISDSLHDALFDLSKIVKGENVESGHISYSHVLQKLAEAGYSGFNRLFDLKDLEEIAPELIDTNSGRVTVEISSEACFLPWEILYPEDPFRNTVNPQLFWGMRHEISRVPVQKKVPGVEYASPRLRCVQSPRLGLVSDTSLNKVGRVELPFFRNLARSNHILLSELKPLEAAPQVRQKQIEELERFCSEPRDMAHFACHAVYDNSRPSQSYLQVTDRFGITVADFRDRHIYLSGNPLVVMNACETGNMNPQFTSDFARVLLQNGARGVISTECKVHDSFAAAFGQYFYSLLLSGERRSKVADVLLRTRQFFLGKYNNPAGLLYAQYGPCTVSLDRSG